MLKIKNIISGRLEVNCYLIYDDITKATIVLDPGENSSLVIKTIQELNLKPELLINTHGHFDHIFSDDIIRQKYNIPLAIHKLDLPLLFDATKNASFIIDKPITIKQAEIVFDSECIYQTSFCSYSTINTPGHTEGSICILINDNLFSGDTLFCGSVGRTDFQYSSPKLMQESLKKLKLLNKKFKVYPGHGPSSTIEQELSSNVFFR